MAVTFHAQECTFLPPERRKLAKWVRAVIEAEGYRTGDIAYIFCSSAYHLSVNKAYLQHDYYTDVITFDYSDREDSRQISGDIFIDPQTVKSNAEQLGVDNDEEQMRVMIHGILHLCGYGDATAEEETAMRALEDRYLGIYKKDNGEYPSFNLG